MTISIQHAEPAKFSQQPRAAFTLVEVMIAMTLGMMVFSGVIGTVLALTKASYNAENYANMEQEARKGLELFARDVRMANNIIWNSTSNISLRIPTAPGVSSYTEYNYFYSNGQFIRTQTYPTTGAAQTLLTGIDPASFMLTGFKISVDPTTLVPYSVDLSNLAQASTDTKQLQLSVRLIRTRKFVMGSTGDVISARFILRNKQVAN